MSAHALAEAVGFPGACEVVRAAPSVLTLAGRLRQGSDSACLAQLLAQPANRLRPANRPSVAVRAGKASRVRHHRRTYRVAAAVTSWSFPDFLAARRGAASFRKLAEIVRVDVLAFAVDSAAKRREQPSVERRLLPGRQQQLRRDAAMNRSCMFRVAAGCDHTRLTAIERLGLKSLASTEAHISRSFCCRLKPKSRNIGKIKLHMDFLQQPRRALRHFPLDPSNQESTFVDPRSASDQLLLLALWR